MIGIFVSDPLKIVDHKNIRNLQIMIWISFFRLRCMAREPYAGQTAVSTRVSGEAACRTAGAVSPALMAATRKDRGVRVVSPATVAAFLSLMARSTRVIWWTVSHTVTAPKRRAGS